MSSNPPKSDISISLLSSTSTAFAVGSSVSPAYVGDSESAGRAVGVDESSPVGESVSPAAVGDDESSPTGENAGFFVGILVASVPPPSASDVGL